LTLIRALLTLIRSLTVEVRDPQDWVVRLRATVDVLQQEKSRLAQDLAAAQQVSFTHIVGRFYSCGRSLLLI